MKAHLFTTLAFAALAALPLSAQQEQPKDRLNLDKVQLGEHNGLPGRWTCLVSCGEVMMVKLDTITSVSTHHYKLEDTRMVSEVTIDTTGNNTIRFYHISEDNKDTIGSKLVNARGLAEKHTGATSRRPTKVYPGATHSHNIEYQLHDDGDLTKVFESVTHAWVKNTSQTLKLHK